MQCRVENESVGIIGSRADAGHGTRDHNRTIQHFVPVGQGQSVNMEYRNLVLKSVGHNIDNLPREVDYRRAKDAKLGKNIRQT